MKSSDIVEKCYYAIKQKVGGKYLKKDMARDMGVNRQYLSALLNEKRSIGKTTAEYLTHALSIHGIKITPGHILNGLSQKNWDITPSENDDEIVHIPYLNDTNGIADTEEVYLPHYRVEASAGGGMYVTETEVNQMLPFKTGWIKKVLRTSKGTLVLLDVKGDSMEPVFNDGDTVMIDKARTDLKKEGYYVIRVEDYLYIKWVQRTIDGGILIKSLNDTYGSQTLRPDELENVAVMGRVVWRAQTLL